MTEKPITRIVDGLYSGEMTIGEFFEAVERHVAGERDEDAH